MKSKWNGKLKCIKGMDDGGIFLTKDKVYEIRNGVLTYDDGFEGCTYKNFEDFIMRNPDFKKHLIEFKSQPDWQIEQSKLAKYIMINEEVTIAIPIDIPMGISFKHSEDEYNEEVGQALALKRLYENMAE